MNRPITDTRPAECGYYTEDIGPYQTRTTLPVTDVHIKTTEQRQGMKPFAFLVVTHDDVTEEDTGATGRDVGWRDASGGRRRRLSS